MLRSTLKGPLRAAMLTLPAGFALLIGGFAAVGLHQRALGVALLVLALLTVGTGCVLAYQFKVQAQSITRARGRRNADLTGTRHQSAASSCLAQLSPTPADLAADSASRTPA